MENDSFYDMIKIRQHCVKKCHFYKCINIWKESRWFLALCVQPAVLSLHVSTVDVKRNSIFLCLLIHPEFHILLFQLNKYSFLTELNHYVYKYPNRDITSELKPTVSFDNHCIFVLLLCSKLQNIYLFHICECQFINDLSLTFSADKLFHTQLHIEPLWPIGYFFCLKPK